MSHEEKTKWIMIYLSAYHKDQPFTLDEWFLARDIVSGSKECQKTINKDKDSPMMRR